MKKSEFTKILRFSIVGVLGVAVDFTVTWFFKEKLSFNLYYSHILGFCAAVTNNYFMNKHWTFEQSKKNSKIQYIMFLITSFIGLLVSTCCIFILNDYLKYEFYLSKIFAIGLAAIWNYLSNRFWVFKSKDIKMSA